MRDFFRPPEKSNFKISPDGKYISYLKPYKKRQNLFIHKLGEDRDTMVTSFTDYKVGDYSWTYGNNIIFTQFIDRKFDKPKSGDGGKPLQDQIRIYMLNVAMMKVRTLLIQDNAMVKTVQTKNRSYPEIITITSNKRDSLNSDVFRLNIRTGELKPYIINPGKVNSWFADQDGVIRLAKASDGVDEYILFRGKEELPWKTIIKNNFKNRVDPIAFSGTKNYFYALSNVDRDKSALVEINADNGKEVNVMFASENADIMDFGYSKRKHQVESVSWEASKQQTQYLDGDIAAIYNELNEQFKGSKARIIDRDSLERRFIIMTYADRDPGSYYLYELDTKKLTKIGESNPAVKSEELCEMKPVSFKATDGTTIYGYLTTPQDKTPNNLPVVVLPHGGPFGNSNRWGYSAEVQFLANRGYAVFQVNFRGSGGYGKAFYHAGFKQMGGLIQQDITDGVKWLINKKIANPKKIAIMGSGFGGFSALNGIAKHPDLYNCAVVQSGLINYFTYIKDVQPWWTNRLAMMYEMVGDPVKDAAMFTAISPAFYPEKIKTPLIIFQGGRDPRANISDLRQFVGLLMRQKTQVSFVLKENERTFSEETKMDMYAEIEIFLNNNMRVKP
ncbi:S9 family peptidase [Mucilaginibacter myungsuensis]